MVVSPATKKVSAKSSMSKASGVAAKGHHVSHPSWIDMIKECITIATDGTRNGVSRPTIKKFVESKYHVAINATSASQLNRAITHGADKGDFILPKGTSGKVKLAPKKQNEATKENAKPASKRSTVAKEGAVPAKATTHKKVPAAKTTRTGAKSAPPTVKGSVTAPPIRKYASSAKKARTVTGSTTQGARKPMNRKATAVKTGAAKKAASTTRKGKRTSTSTLKPRNKRLTTARK